MSGDLGVRLCPEGSAKATAEALQQARQCRTQYTEKECCTQLTEKEKECCTQLTEKGKRIPHTVHRNTKRMPPRTVHMKLKKCRTQYTETETEYRTQ